MVIKRKIVDGSPQNLEICTISQKSFGRDFILKMIVISMKFYVASYLSVLVCPKNLCPWVDKISICTKPYEQLTSGESQNVTIRISDNESLNVSLDVSRFR